MTATGWRSWVRQEAEAIENRGQWRALPAPVPGDVVSFASNDYLGLAHHPGVVVAAGEALARWGTGAGSARLVAGALSVHAELEQLLAQWKRTEAALLFPTGYAANLGVLGVFGATGVRILSDERNHASIVDGCRLARAEVRIYRHGDVDHVAALLAEPGAERLLVVTDTVFSMDGDIAPVEALTELCAARGVLLVLDEAHAVLGPDPNLDGVDHLRVGTLSKFLGSAGGFVAGGTAMVELLVNRARPFVFTTAGTPADAAAALAALRILMAGEGRALAERLRTNVDHLAPGHPSPIVAVAAGSEGDALALAARLRERGMLVPAIRPPTVAPGTSRLRISLSARHTTQQVDALAGALRELTS